jgi:UDP-N-acetylmuramoylalanine--D-glutamate ligase
MRDAVRQAREALPDGGTVLMSPACASFDMFTDYNARGVAFQEAVQEILNNEGQDADGAART